MQTQIREPVLKRMPTVIDRTRDIQKWDVDNLYPQRCDELVGRAFTLKAVMDKVADFLNGEGFEDDMGTLIVNQEGETLDELLSKVSIPFSRYRSFALHVGYDLNYEMCSLRYIPLNYLRFGLADAEGCVDEIKYCTNWEVDYRKTGMKPVIDTYPIYDPDPEVVQQQMEDGGGIENWPGQIFWLTPEPFQYPLATFDAIFDQAQTQAEVATARLAGLQNSFNALLAIVIPGEFEDDEERDGMDALIQNKSGSRNFGSTVGFQDKSGTRKASDIFQQLTPPNLDKLFTDTDSAAKDSIMENEAMPKELLGVRPESGMFNQDNMEQAYIYFNAMTRNRRMLLEKALTKLLMYWQSPIKKGLKIKPQTYSSKPILQADQITAASNSVKGVVDLQTAVNAGAISYEAAVTMLVEMFGFTQETAEGIITPQGQLVPAPVIDPVSGEPIEPPAAPPKPAAPPAPVNEHLKNLTGKQNRELKRVVREFQKGELSIDQAVFRLVESFGFTAEKARQYLESAPEVVL